MNATAKASDLPSIGHNLPDIGIDDDQMAAWLAKMTAAKARVVAAREEYKGIRKEMRAAGFKLGVLDRALELAQMTREEVQDETAHQLAYARFLKLPIGTQLELTLVALDGDDDPTEPDDPMKVQLRLQEAEGAGFRCAMLNDGAKTDCPHPGRSPAYKAWMKGFEEGQKKRQAEARPVDVFDGDDNQGNGNQE